MRNQSNAVKDFEIRRIFLPDEAKQIRALQTDAPEFHRHYPRHNEWLDMAIEQIVSGLRVAFGVYKLAFDSHHRPKVELVGSIILKKRLFSSIIEMKNLFIKPNCRGMGYGKFLYEEVEEYCAKSGYSAIETEVPCSEIGTVNFLHKMGFRVTEMKQSPYRNGEFLYEMKKSLFPFYGGDCFDLYEMALWLITNYYAFSRVRSEVRESKIEFNLETNADLAAPREEERLNLKGLALIIEGDRESELENVLEIASGSEFQILVVFARRFKKRLWEKCSESRVKLIDEQMLHRSFEHLLVYKPLGFSKDDIAGMIVAMNPEYFFRIASKQPCFTYFKGGPIGKYLREGHRLLVLSEPTPKHPEGGIKGIAHVVETLSGSPERVWDHFKDRNPLFREEEYHAFSRNKRNILGILVRDFQEIPTIGYARIEEVLGKRLSSVELGHHYVNHRMLTDLVSETQLPTQNSLQSSVAVPYSRVTPNIRVLFLTANPSNTVRLRLDQESRAIDHALRGSEFRDRFDIRQHWAVRVADIQELLLRHQPDIVHFSGHSSSSSEIVLEDNHGNSHPVSVDSLRDLFLTLKDNIRCVVLNACYSEQQARAIAEHIECVIGMSGMIGDESATSFATAFYRALGYGKDVETAFKLGCTQINLENLGEQNAPKLLAITGEPSTMIFVNEL